MEKHCECTAVNFVENVNSCVLFHKCRCTALLPTGESASTVCDDCKKGYHFNFGAFAEGIDNKPIKW